MSSLERRKLEFNSFDEITTEIETLAAGNARTTGNHGFPAIVRHLAITNEMVVGDRVPPKLPLHMRLMMPFVKGSILGKPVEPGFKLPNSKMQTFFWPEEEASLPDAVERFKTSVQVYQEKGPLPVHPVFGKATSEQVDTLMLNHAAMHLSFVHPQ